MKKITLFLAMLMTIPLATAQNYDVLEIINEVNYAPAITNIKQMRDESILACIRLFTLDNNGWYQDSYGWRLLKVSRDCSEVLDTVFIEDPTMSPLEDMFPAVAMMELDPSGDGYIFASIRRDSILPNNYLSIRHFDEELVFDMENEIRVPLDDSVSLGYEHFCLDGSDIILYYPMIGPNREFVLSRFGLDGSLKHRQVIADTLCPVNQPLGNIRVWNESPKEYVVNGKQLVPYPGGGFSEAFLRFGVLDSLFGIEELMEYNGPLNGPPWCFIDVSVNDAFYSLDDSTYVFFTGCSHINNSNNARGVQITRRDKRTHRKLKTVVLQNPEAYYTTNIIDIQKTSDDCLYAAYSNDGIIIIKMDMDLNVIWQRKCHSSTQNPFGEFVYSHSGNMQVLEDGGLAIAGCYHYHNNCNFILSLSRDGTGTPEAEAFLRPYMFYPNPAQDQLHLQYSPDVQPAQIELYDLQGCLVRTQRNALETLDLQGLATGQYLMKVTLENGKSYTDKVVKE